MSILLISFRLQDVFFGIGLDRYMSLAFREETL